MSSIRTNYDSYSEFFSGLTAEKVSSLSDSEKSGLEDVVVSIVLSSGHVRRTYGPKFYRSQYEALRKAKGVWGCEAGMTLLEQRSNAGTGLCRAHCRGLYTTTCGANKSSLSEKMRLEKPVRDAVRWLIREGKQLSPLSIEDKVKVTGAKGSPVIFLPSRAKNLYDKYVPEGGVVYDYAFGWGSRALGAQASSTVKRYIGVDPNMDTFRDVSVMLEDLCIFNGIENKCALYCVGSENFALEQSSVDFAFSSPPYFNLEVYSREHTQSIERFPVYQDWLEGYVRPTIRNIRFGLKPTGRFAVNVKSFKGLPLEDDWCRIATEEGFVLEDTVLMITQKRPGDGSGRPRGEPIFIFSAK